MFTGIVERMGVVVELREGEASRRLVIDADGWPSLPQLGESISVSGCCLTLVETDAGGGPVGAATAARRLHFDVIPQTLAITTLGQWTSGRRVNLERSATPTSLLGGHLVQGHVDGTGRVVAVQRATANGNGDWRLRVSAPAEVAPFLVPRGSIAIDGVSLTVAAVDGNTFEVALIPETLARTTLGELREGEHVNLEADAIAKLVDASVRRALGKAPQPPG